MTVIEDVAKTVAVAAVAGVIGYGVGAWFRNRAIKKAMAQPTMNETLADAAAVGQKRLVNYFNTAYDQVEKAVEYSDDWANGTGYMNGAVKGIEVPKGTMVKSIDPAGRRILLIGLENGNLVIFERYTTSENVEMVLATNSMHVNGNVVAEGYVGPDKFKELVSHYVI